MTRRCASFPDLVTVDASLGIDLLEGHSHHEGSHEHEHEEAVNEHYWVSPSRYAVMVENLQGRSVRRRPRPRGSLPCQRGGVSGKKSGPWKRSCGKPPPPCPSRDCITFHDSVVYLADDLGLTVAASLSIGEESGIAASAKR